MKKLCGACAQKAGTSLKDRMQLALSRQKDVTYECPGCGKEHFLASNRVEESAETGENAEIQETRENFVQTRLF
ncbi:MULTISPECIES: hypothetical protein [unclassified Paenibacillus]|uniref:hypothetical protein n=1 Tax=unclassified Paenibacillus TaxID=185978 RepID=UPI000466FD94|nr:MULTISPECIES: hypothetical protein [unclassified Paenibacillus]KGP85300.1 hypothetical protein P364_0101400 [Paenibacillus sp. MAEPY2]KGP88144.1 hypothetical protein P363_0108260 [Paenibacillus sp. MAEPY1]